MRTHSVSMLESELKPRPRHIVSGIHVDSDFNMEAAIFLHHGIAVFGVKSLPVSAEIQVCGTAELDKIFLFNVFSMSQLPYIESSHILKLRNSGPAE
jgi:hypothetical protein